MRAPAVAQMTAAGLFVAGALLLGSPVFAGEVTVFAAASLKNALDDIGAAWEGETGHEVVPVFAGSSALAKQIQAGAPADIFISANSDWMDVLQADGLIKPDTRVDLLTNQLVLIAGKPDAQPVDLSSPGELVDRLGNEWLAMALVEAVPAGIYGKAALTSLGVWSDVAPMVAQTQNVRAALALVATGEARMGIVYATDASADDDATVVATFPPESHPPIRYPAAVVAESENPLSVDFLAHLRGEAASAAFQAHGFTTLSEDGM
ncbi:molybdate ABC transporter substrate-binding protein [Aliiroseovarius sp. YM-037]|uniref:molybdate ABC transporter substrate-binding protein n=1 Tax=Aliiroseovarius sp. YM-037 TaxID=3341728 RepID=UPI003A7F8428